MDSLTTILIFAVILVVSIVIITMIQKREQEKAELRQKISQYKYRAKQATDILANFAQTPIGLDARRVLIRYSLANLKAVNQLNPQDGINNSNIEFLNSELKTTFFPGDSQPLTVPTDLQELQQKVSQFSTLAKFIKKISASNTINQELGRVASQNIIACIFELKICAHFQQGKQLLDKHNYVQAQDQFISAKELLQQLPQKNEKLSQIETELHQLMNNKVGDDLNAETTIDKAINKGGNTNSESKNSKTESNDLSSNESKTLEETTEDNAIEQEPTKEAEDQVIDSSAVFAPKKKW